LFKYLPEESCLVHNNSRVFPCRLKAKKPSGGAAEIFLLSLTPHKNNQYSCLIKSSSKKKEGDLFIILSHEGESLGEMELCGKGEDGTFYIKPVQGDDISQWVYQEGKVPIPPYIRKGESDQQDLEDYQTLYAGNDKSEEGSVAAPTAGLHFTENVFKSLEEKNISRNFVTLHVGLGTFRPVKTENLKDHTMHSENFFVKQDEWKNILKAKKRIAVGTTSLRVLESLWSNRNDSVWEEMNETQIFLHPGVKVQSIDGLLTNFHLPESTLLMLVSSLIGREKTLELYKIAVKEKYRFFSYGDAMLILRKDQKGTSE
ncbi:MAG: tRNA preQ1(34) S-adenosylmethionine ribosyltransferase-isomerase QueA, partial [Halobacteriovoraceae bacterium]|nr:tRNA preQ1(34) S-adenosylmethionine ribosyltransferase-isomerase QueA [Halobacteriovoraceae bacterium]